jgi:hypothetical protein
MPLIDPDEWILGEPEHWSKGVKLHLEKDCPRDESCPVYVAWHCYG